MGEKKVILTYFSSEGRKCTSGKKSAIRQQGVWWTHPNSEKVFLSLICITYLMVLVLQFIQCTRIANKCIITKVKLPHRVSCHCGKISWY